jgi:hypothetical protein
VVVVVVLQLSVVMVFLLLPVGLVGPVFPHQ